MRDEGFWFIKVFLERCGGGGLGAVMAQRVLQAGQMAQGVRRWRRAANRELVQAGFKVTELIAKLCADPELLPDPDGLAKALREPLLKVFPPALLGRLVTIPYYPLTDAMLARIVQLQLGRIRQRVEQRYKVPLEVDDAVVSLVVSRCTESESGGRMIDAILTNTMLPDISRQFLERLLEGRAIGGVHVGVAEGQFSYTFD